MKGFQHRDNVKVRPLEEELAELGLNSGRVISEIERNTGLLEQGPVPLPLGGLMEDDETPRSLLHYGNTLLAEEEGEELEGLEEAKYGRYKKGQKINVWAPVQNKYFPAVVLSDDGGAEAEIKFSGAVPIGMSKSGGLVKDLIKGDPSRTGDVGEELEAVDEDEDVLDEGIVDQKLLKQTVDTASRYANFRKTKNASGAVKKAMKELSLDLKADLKSLERVAVSSVEKVWSKAESVGDFDDEPLIEKKWIQQAIKDPGRVREYLGVDEGETIPIGKLNAAIEKLKAVEDKSSEQKSLLSALVLAKRFKGGLEKENLDEESLDEAGMPRSGPFGKGKPEALKVLKKYGYEGKKAEGLVDDWESGWGVLNVPKDDPNKDKIEAAFSKIFKKHYNEAELISDLLYLIDEGWEPLDEVRLGIVKKKRGGEAKREKRARRVEYIKQRGAMKLKSKRYRKTHKRQIKRAEKRKLKKFGRKGLAKLHKMGRRVVQQGNDEIANIREEIRIEDEFRMQQQLEEQARKEAEQVEPEPELSIYTESLFYAAQTAMYLGEVFDALGDEAGAILFELSDKAVDLADTFTDAEPTAEQEEQLETVLEAIIAALEAYDAAGSPSLDDAIAIRMVESGEAEWDDLFEYRPPSPESMGFGDEPAVKHGQAMPAGKTAHIDPSIAGKALKQINKAMQAQSVGDAVKAANEVARKHTVRDHKGKQVKSVTDMKGVFKVMYYLSQATGLGAPTWMYKGKPKPWWLRTAGEKKASADLSSAEKEALEKKGTERKLDKQMLGIFKAMGAPKGFLAAMGEWIEEDMWALVDEDYLEEMIVDQKLLKQTVDTASRYANFRKTKNAKGAVKKAMKELSLDLKADLKSLERVAVSSVEKAWSKAESVGEGDLDDILDEMAPINKGLFDKVVLMARNEGSFYKKRDAAGAVKKAIKYYTREFTLDLKADLKSLERHAADTVASLWAKG